MPGLKDSILLPALAILTASCGTQIDGVRIEAIQNVSERPELFGTRPGSPGYGQYIQIDLSAPPRFADALDEVDAFYPKVEICGAGDKGRIIALGPMLADGRDLPFSAAEMPLNGQGRAQFRLFIVPAHPMPKVDYDPTFDSPHYDLVNEQRPLCISVESNGFAFERTRTNTIEIPASELQKTLSTSPS